MSERTMPRRTQAERTQERKARLIREAMRFFARRGFRGARLSEIARAAGITEPGLLHHFPSKEHLLMEVLAERDRIDNERFGLSHRSEARDPLASLAELVEYNATVPGLVQLFTVLVAESIDEQHPGHAFFKKRYRNVRDHHVDLLQRAQERGEIRADVAAEDLAAMIVALMDGLQIQWLFERSKVDMARIFEQFRRLLAAR